MTMEEKIRKILEYRIGRAMNEPIDDVDWFIDNAVKDILDAIGSGQGISMDCVIDCKTGELYQVDNERLKKFVEEAGTSYVSVQFRKR